MEFAVRTMGILLPKLLLLLKEEYRLQKSVKEGIRFLIAELESMQAALEKVSDVPADQLDKQVKLWARDVREMSYDIEDSVDTFLVRLDSKKPRHIKGFIDRALYMLSKVRIRHKLAADMKSIKSLVREVKERRDRYKIDNIVAKPTAASVDPRLSALFKSVSELVGIGKAVDELTMMLSRGDDVSTNRLKIISVVGVGGLGKTTLAKTLYDKLRVQYRCSAFISVGQNPNVKNILKDILLELDRQKYGNIHSTEQDETQLIKLLHEFLSSKRYFIVIDDIWDIHSWETIKLALVENSCGSRIIVTTRKLEIASEAGDVYNLKPLTSDYSEKLYCTRIFGGEGKYPKNQLDELPGKILKKCGGIPLAIITMASLLSAKPREQWFEVYSSIGYRQAESTMRILSLSYYDMPSHLRTCLLYLSVFPEDYVIMKDSLIWKWIAEGFVHGVQGIGLFELGERYFNQLINRNMIQPVEQNMYPSFVYGCRVHDMVLGLIRSLSEEENFVTIMDNEYDTSPHSKFCRISLQNRNEEHNHDVPIDMTHARSLVACSCSISMMTSLSSFHVLRVLALERCRSKKGVVEHFLLAHVGTLPHLRYLGLASTPIGELPEEIGALKFLQTLDLTNTGIIELPLGIGQQTQLMCLHCDYNCTEIPANGVIGKLTSLEELKIYPGRDAFNETEGESTWRFVNIKGCSTYDDQVS